MKKGIGRHANLSLVATVLALTMSSCGQDDAIEGNSQALASNPYQEVYDAGLTKYVGTPLVKPSKVTTPIWFPRIDVYHYATSDSAGRGPRCMRGTEFFIEASDGPSDQLLIFLEMGGVCLDEICAATSLPLLSLQTLTIGNLIGMGGVLDRFDLSNPMKKFDIVHIPYCDGSIFMGDVDRVLSDGYSLNGSEDKAYQRGLQNLTAGLSVAKTRYPNPSRIVLAGTSGGAYGIVAGTALTRYYYPTTEILVIGDSGAPMLRDLDKDFVKRSLTQLNAIQYVPASCPDCIANGHVTKLITWALARDKNLSVAFMSHADDGVIGDFFMKSPPPIFRNALVREATYSKQAFPNRVHLFITPGNHHTYLINGGVIPDLMMQAVLYAFGWVLFSGDNVSSTTLAQWTLGSLYEKGIDSSGNTVSGYRWLTNLLKSPSVLKDVVNIK